MHIIYVIDPVVQIYLLLFCPLLLSQQRHTDADARVSQAREKWGVRGRMDPRAVALLQSSPRLRAVFEHAKHNRGARVALKQQLT